CLMCAMVGGEDSLRACLGPSEYLNMRSRFVRPEPVVIPISDGDTITVRRRLNAGEQHEMQASMYRLDPDGRLQVDPRQVPMALVAAFLLDWSLSAGSTFAPPVSKSRSCTPALLR